MINILRNNILIINFRNNYTHFTDFTDTDIIAI